MAGGGIGYSSKPIVIGPFGRAENLHVNIKSPRDRMSQEVRLLMEYVDSAKELDYDFLKLHGDLLLSYIRDAERSETDKAA